jgi:hypothetical protein
MSYAISPTSASLPQHIFIEGKFVCSIDRPLAWRVDDDEGYCIAYSYHYFCPVCGRDWAQALFLNSPIRHIALHQPCEKHKFSNLTISGSLLIYNGVPGLMQDPVLFHYMPRVLLEREFRLGLKFLTEKGL